MWEEEGTTTTFWKKNLVLGVESDCDLMSPYQDLISPLSSTGNGSPYSAGSMSPDTTSSCGAQGSMIWNVNENGVCTADLFGVQNFGLGSSGSSSIMSIFTNGAKGHLPALHQWRKIDLQLKYTYPQQHGTQNDQPSRFIFPEVTTVSSKSDVVAPLSHLYVQNSGPPVNNSGSPSPIVTSSTPCPVATLSKPSKRGRKKQSAERSNKSLSLWTAGQRNTKCTENFKASSEEIGLGLSPDSEITSSTSSPDGNRSFDCMWIDCRSSFVHKDSLIEHIDRFHVQTRKEDFSCFWHGCIRRNRPFNARYKLLIHMRVHTGHKPNKCTVDDCDKAFSRLENLKIHLRSHTGERPYICPYCPKAFSNSSDRAKHQRTHFDSKPYACTFLNCDKRYTDPSSLRKHTKMHYLVGVKGVKLLSSKTEDAHQRKRIRRNHLGGGIEISSVTVSVVQEPKVTETKTSGPQPLIPVKQETHNPDRADFCLPEFSMGNGDPSLGSFAFSTCPPFSSLSPTPTERTLAMHASVDNELKLDGSAITPTDLDGISLGELDWMAGVNLDDAFDIDYL